MNSARSTLLPASSSSSSALKLVSHHFRRVSGSEEQERAKEGVSSEGGSLKHCNNPKNIVEKMKRKGCHTVNDIEHRIKSTLTKNLNNIFYNNSIFVVFMKKKSSVVQAQFGRCIMSLETKESTANVIVIRAKGTNLHFSPREFVVVTGLNCVSNKDDFVFDEDLPNRLIEDYFGGAKYIQKRELFAAFSKKLWGKDNDEDAVKFANVYFIHAFLLSVVDTVVISFVHFDLVESGRYSDYPWESHH
ncbi:hypothetical protein BC332_26173 [Capsicum chinense]|nr:hypothetical protein BC332_26173 [Capsicum chinense]